MNRGSSTARPPTPSNSTEAKCQRRTVLAPLFTNRSYHLHRLQRNSENGEAQRTYGSPVPGKEASPRVRQSTCSRVHHNASVPHLRTYQTCTRARSLFHAISIPFIYKAPAPAWIENPGQPASGEHAFGIAPRYPRTLDPAGPGTESEARYKQVPCSAGALRFVRSVSGGAGRT